LIITINKQKHQTSSTCNYLKTFDMTQYETLL